MLNDLPMNMGLARNLSDRLWGRKVPPPNEGSKDPRAIESLRDSIIVHQRVDLDRMSLRIVCALRNSD